MRIWNVFLLQNLKIEKEHFCLWSSFPGSLLMQNVKSIPELTCIHVDGCMPLAAVS
jgi:hypothetical protein